MFDNPDVVWIPKMPFGHADKLQTASATDAVISTNGNIHVKAGKYQQILRDGQLSTDVMTGFCKVLPPGFYETLTNTKGTYRERSRNKVSLPATARYTQDSTFFNTRSY